MLFMFYFVMIHRAYIKFSFRVSLGEYVNYWVLIGSYHSKSGIHITDNDSIVKHKLLPIVKQHSPQLDRRWGKRLRRELPNSSGYKRYGGRILLSDLKNSVNAAL